MKNPNGSDIPGARALVLQVIDEQHGPVSPEAKHALWVAFDKMKRQTALRIARTQQRVKIDEPMKVAIRQLSQDLSLSNADIAKAVGLPACASGRVTEVLQGLR